MKSIPGTLGMKELAMLAPARDVSPRKCECGQQVPELRYCRSNNAAAYQCGACNSTLSCWIPHASMPAINVLSLPRWERERKNPGQQSLI